MFNRCGGANATISFAGLGIYGVGQHESMQHTFKVLSNHHKLAQCIHCALFSGTVSSEMAQGNSWTATTCPFEGVYDAASEWRRAVNSTTLQTDVFKASHLSCQAFADYLPWNQKQGDCFIFASPGSPGYPFDVGRVSPTWFCSFSGCFLLPHRISFSH